LPEGPSIIIFKKDLDRFVGKKVKEATGVSKTIEPARLKGKTLTDIKTFGKHLLLCFGEGLTLRIHFLMFGTYRFDKSKEAPIRLHLDFGKAGEVNFYTCSLRFIEEDLDDVYDWRGDILSKDWDAALALKKMKEQPEDRMICDVLLDQDIFAGLGNIIKNEVLFRMKVHPESLVGAIPLRKKKEIIKDAVDYAELFLEWRQQGVLKKHWQAHRKSICPRDETKLTKRHTGKGDRQSFWCEECQKFYG
jgi:endonuclease-8